MNRRKRQLKTALALVDRWFATKTPLFCMAGVRSGHEGAATIAITKGVLQIVNVEREEHAILKSDHGSFVYLTAFDAAVVIEVDRGWKGTRINIGFAEGAAMVLADYNCSDTLLETKAAPRRPPSQHAQSAQPKRSVIVDKRH